MSKLKKLVLVSATFALMTDAKGENVIIPEKVPYIHYPVQVQKGKKEVTKALINSGNELNVMTLAYAKQLGQKIR